MPRRHPTRVEQRTGRPVRVPARSPVEPVGGEPSLTPDTAGQFARLTRAGLSASEAMGYLAPESVPEDRARWGWAWSQSPEVDRARARLDGSPWDQLPAGEQRRIALEKHLAELARFLYCEDYAAAGTLTFKKLVNARQAINDRLVHAPVRSPFDEFLKDLKEGRFARDGVAGAPIRGRAGRARKSQTIQ